MMMHKEKLAACLVLADGSTFDGFGFGAIRDVLCEVVFTTAPGGYTETLSDPSYGGQAVVLTFPELGNHGVFKEQMQSDKLHLSAVLVRQFHEGSMDPRADLSINDWLKENKVPGIYGVDTRALTFHLRESGSMNGKICFGDFDKVEVLNKIRAWTMPKQVPLVSTKERIEIGPQNTANGKHIALLDYGSKRAMAEHFAQLGCRVTVLPYNTSAEQVLELNPDGVFLANGPGDPRACAAEIAEIKKLLASNVPIFAICLGHQLLALALGAETEKMKFGHRGENHPVRRVADKRLFITSQNHGYVVVRESLKRSGAEVSFESVHDETVEGFHMPGKNISAVQFHPEANPGPEDTEFLFKEFVDSL